MSTQETTTKENANPKKASKKTAKAKKHATSKKASKATKAKGAKSGSKAAIVLELMRRKEGATLAEIAKATDWQNHSIRGLGTQRVQFFDQRSAEIQRMLSRFQTRAALKVKRAGLPKHLETVTAT